MAYEKSASIDDLILASSLKLRNRGREYTLNEIMPNGKRLGDCNKAEVKEAAEFYNRISRYYYLKAG